MAKKTIRKRVSKPKKVERKFELAALPDAIPIEFPKAPKEPPPMYRMTCWAGEYEADSWIGLGWEIFKHRLWHLWNHGSFMD
jgi:hypothetical protein